MVAAVADTILVELLEVLVAEQVIMVDQVDQEIHLQLVHHKVNQVDQLQEFIIFQVLAEVELELLDKIDNLVVKVVMVVMV